SALIRGQAAALGAQLLAPGVTWQGSVTTKFPVPVDPKYTSGDVGAGYVTNTWHDQAHLTVESTNEAKEFVVYAVLWPKRDASFSSAITTIDSSGTLTIKRPDAKTDVLTLTDASLTLK